MGQKKSQSWIESISNMAIGYLISIGIQPIVFSAFNIHVDLKQDMEIGILFTLISIVRNYYVRRLFNWIHIKTSASTRDNIEREFSR